MTRSLALQLCCVLLTFALSGCGGNDNSGGGSSYADRFDRIMKEPSPDRRARQLLELAVEQYEAKDKPGAEKSLDEAEAAAQQLGDDPLRRATIYMLYAETLAKVGEKLEASQALGTATAAAEKIEEPFSRASTLTDIARIQGAVLERPADAERTLATTEETADSLQDARSKTEVLASIALAYSSIENKNQADRVLGKALDYVRSLDVSKPRCDALIIIAAKQIDMDRVDAGVATLDEATETAQQLEDYSKVFCIVDIAKQLSEAKRRAEAHALLDEVLGVAKGIDAPDQQREATTLVRETMSELPKPKS